MRKDAIQYNCDEKKSNSNNYSLFNMNKRKWMRKILNMNETRDSWQLSQRQYDTRIPIWHVHIIVLIKLLIGRFDEIKYTRLFLW